MRELSAREVSDYAKRHAKGDADELDLLVYLVRACTLDEQGQPLFLDDDADADAIKSMPLGIIRQIGEAVTHLSGLDVPQDEKKEN